jgi:hypothetical protein
VLGQTPIVWPIVEQVVEQMVKQVVEQMQDLFFFFHNSFIRGAKRPVIHSHHFSKTIQ